MQEKLLNKALMMWQMAILILNQGIPMRRLGRGGHLCMIHSVLSNYYVVVNKVYCGYAGAFL
jgi:hypothetical protein